MTSSRQLIHPRMKCRSSSKSFTRIPNAILRCFIYLSERVENLKEGHFAVLTKGNEGHRKFLVALSYLRYPPFLELLEAAEQEFGFDQPGVLVVPCEASELQRILSGSNLADHVKSESRN